MHRSMTFCRIPLSHVLALCSILMMSQACSSDEANHTRLNKLEERVMQNLGLTDAPLPLDKIASQGNQSAAGRTHDLGAVKKKLGQVAEALRNNAVHTRLDNGDDAYDLDGMRYVISDDNDATVMRAGRQGRGESFLAMHVAPHAGSIMFDAKQYATALESFGYGPAGEAFGQVHLSYDTIAGNKTWALKVPEGLHIRGDGFKFDLAPSPELITASGDMDGNPGILTVKLGALSYSLGKKGEHLSVPSMHFVARGEKSANISVVEGVQIDSPIVRIADGKKTTVIFDRTLMATVQADAQWNRGLIVMDQAGTVQWSTEAVTGAKAQDQHKLHWTHKAALRLQSAGRGASIHVVDGDVTMRSNDTEKTFKSGDLIGEFPQR